MKLGLSLPQTDIGGDPATVKDFARFAEDTGFSHLATYDHVVGVNPASRPGWDGVYDSADYFHDAFVLLAYLAGVTERIELTVQVLILSQRQTVLVAKQCASLDVLCGGRFRLGVGIGWNEAEFTALDVDFNNRGERSEEQVRAMKALWTQRHVELNGKWHSLPDVGLEPRPLQQPFPVWFGGHHDRVLRRIARVGDGWMPLAYPPNETARVEIEKLRKYAIEEGRSPDEIGIDGWVSMEGHTPQEWRDEVMAWQSLGATYVTLNTAFEHAHHHRIPGTDVDSHVSAAKSFYDAVSDLL